MENVIVLILGMVLAFASGAVCAGMVFWLGPKKPRKEPPDQGGRDMLSELLRDVPEQIREQYDNLMRYDGTKRGQKPIEKD